MANRLPVLFHRYLGEVVYGAHDGVITTFALVAGATGAALDQRVALILGFANLLADGISMAGGDYLAERSRHTAFQGEGLSERKPALQRAMATFVAFELVGTVPLIAYLMPWQQGRFGLAIAASALALFTLGAARALVIRCHWVRSGLEMLVVGAAAGGAAFAIGAVLSRVFGTTGL
ncbi:MAG: VIT1/CCC1 transporter family protein [Candidatus Sericytochromatia bacterium]